MSPIYEYSCTNCKHTEEKFEPITAELVQDCPKCAFKGTLVRKIGVPLINFKGNCWYRDSYTGSKQG